MITQIHHKRNEIFQVEFFEDAECTVPFDFTGKKNLYIEPKDGDLTSLFYLNSHLVNQDLRINNLMIPHIVNDENILYDIDDILKMRVNKIYTLGNDAVSSLELECIVRNAVPNLSKYIPEDNAVLFLSGEKISLLDYDGYYNMFSGYRDIEFEGKIIEGMPYHPQIYGIHTMGDRVSVHMHEHGVGDYTNFTLNILKGKKLTIFLPHGTYSELRKAVEVKKELKEKYGAEEVNLCVLHWFDKNDDYGVISFLLYNKVFNEIITTNSTGILKAKDFRKRLQVIDSKEFFEEYFQHQERKQPIIVMDILG